MYLKLTLSVLSLLAGMTAAVQAADSIPRPARQLVLTGGPLAGGNLSNLTHSNFHDCSSAMRAGFYAGGAVRVSVLPRLSIEGDLSFHYRQADFSMYGNPGRYEQWCAEVAVYAVGHLNLGNRSRFNFGLGPYTDFGLGATYRYQGKTYNLYSRELPDGKPMMATSETGISAKIGYEFGRGIEIAASYRISVNNLAEANNTGAVIRPQTVSLGVAWFFGKD